MPLSGRDVFVVDGCTAPFGEQSRNIARNAWLQEGYPPEVPAVVLDRRCGSARTVCCGGGLGTGTLVARV